MTFKKEKKLRETDNGRENDVKFNIPPIDAALETPLALALTILFCNLMKRWYNTKYSVINEHTIF